MRKILFCLALPSLMSGCATSNGVRTIHLDPSTFAAICGADTAGRPSPPVALAASANSPLPAGSVSCGAARGPASAEYQKVALTFTESDKGLARPNSIILVSASRPRDGRLSPELVETIKSQTSMAGMSRVVMIEKTPLTDRGIYLGYAYP